MNIKTPLALDDLARAIGNLIYGYVGPDTPNTWGTSMSAAKEVLTTIEQAGWKIVPVEATAEMIEVGGERVFSGSRSAAQVGVSNAWQAMLSASPQIEGE